MNTTDGKTCAGRSALLLTLILASGLAAAQSDAPAPSPRINRNPVFRQSLPPAPPLPPDPRDTVLPAPGPSDPRATVIAPPPTPGPRASTVPEPGIEPPASSPRTSTTTLPR